jgi:hypothetical protein
MFDLICVQFNHKAFTYKYKNKMVTATKSKRALIRIWVTDEITRTLMAEFDTTGNTVRLALRFISDSELSKKIRNRAIALMEDVNKKNKKNMAEYDQD